MLTDQRLTWGALLKRIKLAVIILVCSAFITVSSAAGNAAVPGARQKLYGHIPPDCASSKKLEKIDGNKRLKLAIGLPLHNRQALKVFLADITNPKSPNYRHYLSSQQFIDMYSPTQEEYDRVADFLKKNGMNPTDKFSDRMMIGAEGAASDVQKAFNVNLYNFRRGDGSEFYAPDGEPSIDNDIPAGQIDGLSNAVVVKPSALTGSGLWGTFAGQDFRNAYAQGAPGSLNGAGQIVGVFSLDDYYSSDIVSYESLASVPNVSITKKIVYGSPTGFYNYAGEVSMDIEAVIAMAPGCQVYVYEAYFGGTAASLDNILQAMSSDTQVKQFTSSFSFNMTSITELNYYLKLESQGQSFFQASGDNGAYAAGTLNGYNYEIPDITVVGGTLLTTSGGSWSLETVWNNAEGKSGGGKSTDIQIPAYQMGITTAANAAYVSTTYRNIPDVAMVADDVLVCANNGTQGIGSGTSFSAPLWAGYCALINQQAALRGNAPVGFLNPAIYSIGTGPNYSADFHDITSGNNGTAANYPAVTGYDLCTGWGSPNGMSLISDLAGPTQSNTPTITNTQTVTNTPTLTATGSFTPTLTATQTVTATSSRTATGSFTPTLTATQTVTATSSRTATGSYTPTLTQTPTVTATSTQTATGSYTPTFTVTPTGTNTPTQTSTGSCTPTFTVTPTDTNSATQTVTGSFTATMTITRTVTNTSTLTATGSYTPTFTATSTGTNTLTQTMSASFTPTFTKTVTLTITLSATGSATNTLTVTPTYTITLTFTVTPVFSPTATLTATPDGGFAITGVLIYPDPLMPEQAELYVHLDATRDPASVRIKIYTTSFRLIKDKTWTASSVTGHYDVSIAATELDNLAAGTYYYVLSADDGRGTMVKSRAGKFIILR
jgi:subtilase family serine protease